MEQNRSKSPPSTSTPTATDANSTDTTVNTCTSSSTPVAPTKQPVVSKTIRMLSKNSHKISKHHQHARISNPLETQNAPQPLPKINGNPPAQPQPPVYNINKKDFREVVQKLTGSPAHQVTSPPPPPPPSPPPNTTTTSTRLHKIRPPPLTQLNPRPNNPTVTTGSTWTGVPMTTPGSPLPPLPTVSLVAESPITTYMRCLNEGGQSDQAASDAPLFPLPTSPLGFGGCVTSSPSPQGCRVPSDNDNNNN